MLRETTFTTQGERIGQSPTNAIYLIESFPMGNGYSGSLDLAIHKPQGLEPSIAIMVTRKNGQPDNQATFVGEWHPLGDETYDRDARERHIEVIGATVAFLKQPNSSVSLDFFEELDRIISRVNQTGLNMHYVYPENYPRPSFYEKLASLQPKEVTEETMRIMTSLIGWENSKPL